MRQRFNWLLAIVAVFVAGAPVVFAHHSVVGEFDTGKAMTLKGTISKVQWMNPHIYLYLEVKEVDGTVSSWALETLPTAMMRKAGLSKETLMGTPGEVVNVNVIPARDGTKHMGWISKITYADGRFYALGGAGPIQ
jgi:Family of unknown function (DUF6152)